jgi:hypothetical protein
MQYHEYIEPLVMYYLDQVSRDFGVALIKRPNIHEYNYKREHRLIDIFGEQSNLNAFLEKLYATRSVHRDTTLPAGTLMDIICAYFSRMDEVSGLYPNIAEVLYARDRPRLEITPSDISNGLNVACSEDIKGLIADWFRETHSKKNHDPRTLATTVLGIHEITHLQSFFPDEIKFDPRSVYEIFPINGMSLAVHAVSAINPFVTMQRDKKYIATFTFQGFIVRQTLQCLRIKSINRDKYEAPKAPR